MERSAAFATESGNASRGWPVRGEYAWQAQPVANAVAAALEQSEDGNVWSCARRGKPLASRYQSSLQLPDALTAIHQPTFDAINTCFVSRAARNSVMTVALAGTAAGRSLR